jgi:hypothetical protein
LIDVFAFACVEFVYVFVCLYLCLLYSSYHLYFFNLCRFYFTL